MTGERPMVIQHHTFWLPERCVTFTALGPYGAAIAALSATYPGAHWRHNAVRNARVRDLRRGAVSAIAIAGLANDARYWDLVRAYGEASREVLRHLSACHTYQANS